MSKLNWVSKIAYLKQGEKIDFNYSKRLTIKKYIKENIKESFPLREFKISKKKLGHVTLNILRVS